MKMRSAGGIKEEAKLKQRRKKRDKAGEGVEVDTDLETVRGENDENDETEEIARVQTLEACSMDGG
jgi:hypothetical protein